LTDLLYNIQLYFIFSERELRETFTAVKNLLSVECLRFDYLSLGFPVMFTLCTRSVMLCFRCWGKRYDVVTACVLCHSKHDRMFLQGNYS